MKAGLVSAAGIVLTFASIARGADDPPGWEPGEPTTSRLPGEIGETDRSTDDGTYGRFAGRGSVAVLAGLEADADGARLAARASAHYFFTAGVYAGYADALDDGSPSARFLSFGVDLQPAFIPRWSEDLEQGPGTLDLFVDSISIGLGVYFREPRGHAFGDARGLELSLGAGFPLLGSAGGPWLGARGLLRWDDPAAAPRRTADGAALVTVGWHFVLGEAEPPR